jgi:hypothetical protein
MHGDHDGVVPLAQSVKLAEALRRAGVEVTLQVYPGSGHGGRAFTSPASWRLIEDFFARHLCAGRAAAGRQSRPMPAGVKSASCNRGNATTENELSYPGQDVPFHRHT